MPPAAGLSRAWSCCGKSACRFEDAVRAFLQALGHSVDDAAHALLDGTPPPDLANRIVMAEQRFRDLSAIAQAERLGLATRNEALRRRVLVLEGCELWARELGQIGLQSVWLGSTRR